MDTDRTRKFSSVQGVPLAQLGRNPNLNTPQVALSLALDSKIHSTVATIPLILHLQVSNSNSNPSRCIRLKVRMAGILTGMQMLATVNPILDMGLT